MTKERSQIIRIEPGDSGYPLKTSFRLFKYDLSFEKKPKFFEFLERYEDPDDDFVYFYGRTNLTAIGFCNTVKDYFKESLGDELQVFSSYSLYTEESNPEFKNPAVEFHNFTTLPKFFDELEIDIAKNKTENINVICLRLGDTIIRLNNESNLKFELRYRESDELDYTTLLEALTLYLDHDWAKEMTKPN